LNERINKIELKEYLADALTLTKANKDGLEEY
jgi:hypothetical protein